MRDQHDGLAEEEQGDEAGRASFGGGPGDDRDLDDAVEEHLDQHLVGAGPGHALHVGAGAHEIREGGAGEPSGQRSEHAQADAAAPPGLGEARRLQALVQHLERAAGGGQEPFPHRRERDAPAPREERASDRGLQGMDARADGGLPDPDGEGGPAEAAFAGDAVEGQELGVVHRGWDCTSRLSIRPIITIVLIDVWS
jgi:hypothetical protein